MNDHTTESPYHNKVLGERIERIADCMEYKISDVAVEVLKLAQHMKNLTDAVDELQTALLRIQAELDKENEQ